MTPIGIWSTANANVKAAMAPVASVDARLVMTRNTTWTAPEPERPRRHQHERLPGVGVAEVDPRRDPGADAAHHRQLDEQVPERAEDDADRETHDAERRHEQERADDDRDVVDDRRERGRPEPALRVEDARRDGAGGEEQRRQHHDPGQLDGLGQLRLVEARA